MRIVHSWEQSRARLGLQATPEEIADAPPLTHPLVRTIPETGEKALFMGEHASHVEGRPMAEGRALLDGLTAHAVEERFVYRHKWRAGDMLMWDNRCLLHRANPNFDAAPVSARAAPDLSARHRAGVGLGQAEVRSCARKSPAASCPFWKSASIPARWSSPRPASSPG